jgi:hypothetical protein
MAGLACLPEEHCPANSAHHQRQIYISQFKPKASILSQCITTGVFARAL